jgi:hypothetical protein
MCHILYKVDSITQNEAYKVAKVILTKNTTLQRIEQLSLIKCNYIRN